MMASNLAPKRDRVSSTGDRKLQRDIEQQLMRLLASYVALRRSDPLDVVLNDLFALEVGAGQFLGEALPSLPRTELRGALAGILTAIPFGEVVQERDVSGSACDNPSFDSLPY